MDEYIDFGVAPYALPKVCEALFKNGVNDAFITLEDGDIHIRWKYKIDRYDKNANVSENCDIIGNNIPTLTDKNFDKLFINCKDRKL